MIHVRVEVAKNTKNVVEENNHYNVIYGSCTQVIS